MKFKSIYAIALSLMLMLLACTDIKTPLQDLSLLEAKIKLNAPQGTLAGSPIEIYIDINATAKPEWPVILFVDNGLTIKKFDCYTNQKNKIEGQHFKRAGLYQLIAVKNNQVLARRKLKIKSAKIADKMQVLTGPNSILVSGLQESMITLIPQDRYDNPITMDQSVSFKTNQAANRESVRPIKNLISYSTLTSQAKTGKILLGASLAGYPNREQAIEQTATWPTDFNIEVVNHHPYADDRQYTRLRTDMITDNNGNIVSDGTQVVFKLSAADKLISSYKSLVIDGRANGYLKNPDQPMTTQAWAEIGPAVSHRLTLNYLKNIEQLVYEYDATSKILKVGPLQSSLNQYVADGTEVTLRYKRKKKTKETLDGRVHFDLSGLKKNSQAKLLLEAGGITETINL